MDRFLRLRWEQKSKSKDRERWAPPRVSLDPMRGLRAFPSAYTHSRTGFFLRAAAPFFQRENMGAILRCRALPSSNPASGLWSLRAKQSAANEDDRKRFDQFLRRVAGSLKGILIYFARTRRPCSARRNGSADRP